MSTLLIAGSPSERSRSAALLDAVAQRLQVRGALVDRIHIRDLSPQALLLADFGHPTVVHAIAQVTLTPEGSYHLQPDIATRLDDAVNLLVTEALRPSPAQATQYAALGLDKLFLISVSVFFPIYLNTFHGIRNLDPGLIEMGRTYGLSRWQLHRQIILPGALSSILVGLRFSLGRMWVILIVAETISAQAGIGYLTMNAREFLQTDIVLVGILLYALLGKLADVFAKGLERYWLRWHPGYQA